MADEPSADEPSTDDPSADGLSAHKPWADERSAEKLVAGGGFAPGAKRAPITASKAAQDGPDILQQLQMKQMERIQLSVQFLTQLGVRSEPKEKKEKYLKDKLHCSEQELEQAFKQALDVMLQPAVDFLLNEQVRPKTVGHKFYYIHNNLGITDEVCEEAFKRIGDPAGPIFFSNKRVATALKFLANPALKDKPGDAKVKFLTGKLKLTQDEVAEAFKQVSCRTYCWNTISPVLR
jgi:hypothetical protein